MHPLFALAISVAGGCGDDSGTTGAGRDAASEPDAATAVGGADVVTDAGNAGASGGTPIAWRDCAPTHTYGFGGQCATESVPLDWDDPTGPVIEIVLRKVLPISGTTKRQVWLLNGGPGYSGDGLNDYVFRLREVDNDLEILVPSFRGTEGTTRFDCERLRSILAWVEPDDAEEVRNCANMLQAEWGDGMRLFSTTSDARDVSDFAERSRTDDVPVFVYGIGYGSVRAQRILQIAPNTWAGAVLDSVMDSSRVFTRDAADFDDAAERVFDACDVDATCRAKVGPDSWNRLRAFLDAADDSGCATSLGLDRFRYQRLFATLLTSKFTVAAAPALLHRAERCDPADEDAIEHAVERSGALDQGSRSLDALGLRVQILASEFRGESELDVDRLTRAMDASVVSAREAAGYRALADAWPKLPKDRHDDAFPETNVPMLLLNGDVDPIGTRELADETGAHYTRPHQTLVHLPHAGEGLLVGNAGPCTRKLLQQFLRTPDEDLDVACRETTAPLAFSDARLADLFGTGDVWDN